MEFVDAERILVAADVFGLALDRASVLATLSTLQASSDSMNAAQTFLQRFETKVRCRRVLGQKKC